MRNICSVRSQASCRSSQIFASPDVEGMEHAWKAIMIFAGSTTDLCKRRDTSCRCMSPVLSRAPAQLCLCLGSASGCIYHSSSLGLCSYGSPLKARQVASDAPICSAQAKCHLYWNRFLYRLGSSQSWASRTRKTQCPQVLTGALWRRHGVPGSQSSIDCQAVQLLLGSLFEAWEEVSRLQCRSRKFSSSDRFWTRQVLHLRSPLNLLQYSL